MMNAEDISEGRARAVVLALIQAVNSEDYERAKNYIDDQVHVEGALGSSHSAAAWLEDLKRIKVKCDIVKIFADGDDVCLFCNLESDGKTIFSSGWYRVEGGKITSLRSVFDPRPLLD